MYQHQDLVTTLPLVYPLGSPRQNYPKIQSNRHNGDQAGSLHREGMVVQNAQGLQRLIVQ